jgi:AraC-like DNA-binding protein
MTFEQYLRGLRLERAKQLLASTRLQVSRVAELSGFNSLQYFCRVFGKAHGMTPIEYRKSPRTIPEVTRKSTHKNARRYKSAAQRAR